MMLNKMKKFLPYVFAIGSAITALIMVVSEVLYMHIPPFSRLVFALFMFGFAITEYGWKKAK